MKKIKKQILKLSMKAKILCGVLALVMVVGAIVYNFRAVDAQAEAVERNKTYLSDIMDRITEGKQKYFTILEIVPYEGVGEFRYYTGEDEVAEGLLSKSQDELKQLYNTCGGYGNDNKWVKMNYLYSNFNYYIKYNSYQNKYEIKCDEIFNNYVLIEPFRSLLEGRVKVNTVEANDLTDADIESADLIILSTTPQDNNTIQCYNYYNGAQINNTAQLNKTNVYDAAGTELNYSQINYETYEKVGTELVSRDISWEMAKKLLDFMEIGRDLRGDGTFTQTPVILDARLSERSSTDGNMYKLALIYRMIESNQYNDFINNHITLTDEAGNRYLTGTGALSAALYYSDTTTPTAPETTAPETTVPETTVDETTNPDETVEPGTTIDETTVPETTVPTPITNVVRMNSFVNTDILKCLEASGCIDTNPNARKRITNDYWVHNGDARIIPANLANKVTESDYIGVDERGLSGKTVADVIRYLLGCKDSYEVKYDFSDGPINILEVEPCNSFRYDTYEKVKALGNRMGFDTSGWTSININQYMKVTCLSTKALNSVTTDLISTYDVIIIGDDYDMLTKNNSGQTIYNDVKLNGYVYLAYGDLVKITSPLMGYLPWDYVKYKGSYSSENQLINDKNYSGIFKANSFPTDTRRSYNWNNYNFGGNAYRNNQLYYNLMYTLNGNTKSVWNEYQWQFLNENFNTGDLVGVVNIREYYENYYQNKNTENLMTTLFADKIGNARLSDNDITKKTADKLKDYADSGKLLVFADMVYENDGTKIYPTSHLANLMNYITTPGSGANYIRESNVSGFITHVNAMSPDLNFSLTPTPIGYDGNGIINKFNSSHKLDFAFTVDGYANTTYKVKLIIDKNGDGIYADTGKVVTDDTNEIFKTILIKTDGNGHADVSLSTKISEKQNGLVAYKVEVSQMKNVAGASKESTLRSSYLGYTAVLAEKPDDVKVLQIVPERQYWSDLAPTLNMGYQIGSIDSNTGLVTSSTANSDAFKKVLDKVNGGKTGYQIQVITISTYNFENKFNPNKGGTKYLAGTSYDTEANYIQANDYDMVVIGFGDCYNYDDISNNYGAVDCIKDFIENGKSVLFAHDTMSYNTTYNYFQITKDGKTATSLKKNASYLSSANLVPNDKIATDLTRVLRNAVGMDRYGITLKEEKRTEKDKPTYTSSTKPAYTTASSDGKYYVQELQGFSDWILTRAGAIRWFYNEAGNGLRVIRPYINSTEVFKWDNENMWTTTEVEKVNEGQVTMYPYKIEDTIPVATTHCQYYQLDMEDEDLVVWYTLKGSGYYDMTRKDGQNNYYIYSKDNVTYTGAGHSDIKGERELELFVNTIIKAIGAGNTDPVVTITNGGLGTGGFYYVYAESDGTYNLKFTVSDPDLTTLEAIDGDYESLGRFKSGRVYWELDGEEGFTDGDLLLESYGEYSTSGKRLYNEVNNTVSITNNPNMTPELLNKLQEQLIAKTIKIHVEATDSKGAKGEAIATLTNRTLFDLD